MTFDLFDAVQPAVETDRNARSGNAALSQFFTPFWVAEELVHDALRNLGTDIHIAEPSCGTGAFLAAIPKTCPARSEEHTSELQSLMRISYAVFCLKKKTLEKYTSDKKTSQLQYLN